MDSEDERFIEKIDNDIRSDKIKDALYLYQYDTVWPETRLYKEDERALASLQRDHDASKIPEITGRVRIHRICRTILGYYMGNLDLSGRHERRYQSLMTRWNEFAQHLDSIPLFAQELAANGWTSPLGRTFQVKHYDADDDVSATSLQAFAKRWRIDLESFSLKELFGIKDSISQLLIYQSRPVYQQLCLHHLPPELIHHIMSIGYADTARKLGSTCHLFRQISLPYIYRTRYLGLKAFNYSELPKDGTLEERKLYLHDFVYAARDTLLDEIAFVLTSPHILHSIERLGIIGSYMPDLEDAGILDDHDTSRQYYEPLLKGILEVLIRSPHIRKVEVCNFEISAAVASTILSLKMLQSLDLRYCKIWPGRLATSNAITHASLQVNGGSPEDLRVWLLLPSLASLQVLYVGGKTDVQSLPSRFLVANSNPFNTVERFVAANIDSGDISRLQLWILSAATANGYLRLTHFKLDEGTLGLCAVDTIRLIRVLHGAPMQYFSLDGIHYAEADLLALIAYTFPNLESLTLQYRQSHHETRSSSARWPDPSWEYAIALSGFTRLKWFRWNYWLNRSEAPSAILRFFEEGWPEQPWWERSRDDEPERYMDWDCIAKLLSAYCPSLVCGIPRKRLAFASVWAVAECKWGDANMAGGHEPRNYPIPGP